MSFDVFDARLKSPFSCIIAGPSMSGKTYFVRNLLKNWNILVDKGYDYIVWWYGQKSPVLEILKQQYKDKIKLIEGVPKNLDEYVQTGRRGIFVFDDSQSEICDSQQVSDLFTKKCHHENICTIVIFQNLFCEGKYRKTIYRNSSYLVLFKSPLDNTLAYSLARKIFPHNSNIFLNIFQKATEKAFGYLFIDGKVDSPGDARFRNEIFNKNYQKVFVPL